MPPGALCCVLFSLDGRVRSHGGPARPDRSGIQAVRPCRARAAPRCVRPVPLACTPLPPLDAVRSPPAARCVGVCEELRHSRARPLPLQAEAGMAGVGTHTHRASVAASRAREVAAMPQRSRDPVLHGPAVQRRMSRRSRRNGGVTVGRTATAWCDGPECRASSLSCCGCSRNGLSPRLGKAAVDGCLARKGNVLLRWSMLLMHGAHGGCVGDAGYARGVQQELAAEHGHGPGCRRVGPCMGVQSITPPRTKVPVPACRAEALLRSCAIPSAARARRMAEMCPAYSGDVACKSSLRDGSASSQNRSRPLM